MLGTRHQDTAVFRPACCRRATIASISALVRSGDGAAAARHHSRGATAREHAVLAQFLALYLWLDRAGRRKGHRLHQPWRPSLFPNPQSTQSPDLHMQTLRLRQSSNAAEVCRRAGEYSYGEYLWSHLERESRPAASWFNTQLATLDEPDCKVSGLPISIQYSWTDTLQRDDQPAERSATESACLCASMRRQQ